MEQYGIKNGSVFTIYQGDEEYVVCDLVTHEFDDDTESTVPLSNPYVVFRSVKNINEMKPAHERCIMPLTHFTALAIVKPITDRIYD